MSASPSSKTASPRSSDRRDAANRRWCDASTGCTRWCPARPRAARCCSTGTTSTTTASIRDNVAAGLTLNGVQISRAERNQVVERSLRQAALWEEVKDRLRRPGGSLSGGQQQRLCVARALAVQPEVLLMDEPCSALDPISTARIEELLLELKSAYTIVIVTHNMQQAARCSDMTAFMYTGDLVEYGETKQIFTNPTRRETEDYITGRFG